MANTKPVIYSDYSDSPQFLKDFLYYMQTIKGLSVRTVEAYYIDLKLFFKYIIVKRSPDLTFESLNELSITGLDISFLSNISQSDILDFLYYTMNDRGNSSAARARKLSSLRACSLCLVVIKKHHILNGVATNILTVGNYFDCAAGANRKSICKNI